MFYRRLSKGVPQLIDFLLRTTTPKRNECAELLEEMADFYVKARVSEEVDAISYTRRPARASEPRAEEQNIGENQIGDGTPGVGLSTHLSG